MKPTTNAYSELQFAFDYFNKRLFENKLPDCLITFQREKKTYGYFSRNRFIHRQGKTTDEIALNPAYFTTCPPEEILQTLVHEMTHLWQSHFGKSGRRGYHNKQWACKMESIGLMPSSTGKEGGAKTGDRMSDYIIENGLFHKACSDLLDQNFKISWADRFPAKELIKSAIQQGAVESIQGSILGWTGLNTSPEDIKTELIENSKKQTRLKFTCPKCRASAWGKPSLLLICGLCNVPLAPA